MPCFTTTTDTKPRSRSPKTKSESTTPRSPSMSLDNSDKTVKATRVFAYRTDGRRYTAGHRVETEIHAMNGSYPCPAGSRRVPAMVHSESEVFSKKIAHEPVPGLPQGYQRVESTVQKAWYRGDLNTWEARWDYTHDIAYHTPHVVSLYFSMIIRADRQWNKCFDCYWAFKEDLNHHKQEWRHVKEDWKHAGGTLLQRLRSPRDGDRAFNRI